MLSFIYMANPQLVSQHDTQWEVNPYEIPVSERPLTRFAWTTVGVGLALLWSPILVALLLSFFDEGTRVMMGIKPMAWPVDPLIYFAFYWAGVHFLLSYPLTQIAYPQTKSFPWPVLRPLALFALLSAPLCSYAYYRAGQLSTGQWVEIFLSVVPSAFAASLAFYRLERRWLFSMWAALGSYIPVFFLNDLMGPFVTYFAYASPSDAFYYFRYIGPMLGMAFLTWAFLGKRELVGAAQQTE